MSKDEAIRSIETGIDIFEEELGTYGIDIMGTGEMGIGNTLPVVPYSFYYWRPD